MIFSSKKELIQDYPKTKVETERKKSKLEEKEWHIALSNLINTDNTENKYAKWIKNNKKISINFKNKCNDLLTMNNILKNKYKANQLKHSAVPHFLLNDYQFSLSIRTYISLEDFYDKNPKDVIFIVGIPADSFKIDDVQHFLIDYNNKMVNVGEDLLKNIKII